MMKNYTTPKPIRTQVFEGVYKVLEVVALISLGLIDVVISGAMWSLFNSAYFTFLGFRIHPSVIGGMIALGFWYASFFLVRQIAPVLFAKGKVSIKSRVRTVLADPAIRIGAIAAVVLWVSDIFVDSFTGVIMVYPEANVFTLMSYTVSGPPAMYIMMLLVAFITTIGEPIVFARLIMLTTKKTTNENYTGYRPSTGYRTPKKPSGYGSRAGGLGSGDD